MDNFGDLPQNTRIVTIEHVSAYHRTRGSLLQNTIPAYFKSRVSYFKTRGVVGRGAGSWERASHFKSRVMWKTFQALTIEHDRRGEVGRDTLPILWFSLKKAPAIWTGSRGVVFYSKRMVDGGRPRLREAARADGTMALCGFPEAVAVESISCGSGRGERTTGRRVLAMEWAWVCWVGAGGGEAGLRQRETRDGRSPHPVCSHVDAAGPLLHSS